MAEGERWGFINHAGEFAIEPQFEMAYDFHEGRAAVMIDGKNGYIDHTGKIVVAPVYEYCKNFTGGLAAVSLAGKPVGNNLGNTGFVDPYGDFVIPPRFGETGRFRSGLCLVTTEQEIGYINKSGEFVWKGPYVECRLGSDLRL